jgi:predicted XRE-type DNA-binding protein
MQTIGPRCHELRIRDDGKQWRLIYRTDPEAILVVDLRQDHTEDAQAGARAQPAQAEAVRPGKIRRMKAMKQRKGKTWVETDVEELLGLSPEDLVIVEFRAALAVALQKARSRKRLTQEAAAEMIGTSQAQVSKMEAGQSSITIDRMIKALAALGMSRPAILKALSSAA